MLLQLKMIEFKGYGRELRRVFLLPSATFTEVGLLRYSQNEWAFICVNTLSIQRYIPSNPQQV